MQKIFLSLLLLTTHFCFAQVNLNLGLRAYYPFNGNANDVSGNNNNPVFNNATLTADRFGNPNSAYHFNGTSQYMRILNSATINTTNTLSLVAWVKPQGFYAGTCHGNSVLMKGDADYLPGNYLLRYDDGAFQNGNNCSLSMDPAHQNFYGSGIGTPPPGYAPYIQTNQWYSVIVTHDGTTSKLYVDCVLKASLPQGSATFTNVYDLYIGRLNSAAFPYWVNGDIDDVRIYDRALNVDEVNTLGGCITQTPCNNWLNTPGFSSYATIGDLDVSGNQMTIEATYNRTGAFNSGIYPGHLVSKHSNTSDDNYSLFPNGCAITTTNGYKSTFETCGLGLNKTYHVALVYDGSFLKFYRNGFLMGQVACTGNLVTNNINATIAQYAGIGPDEQFIGNVNEVRIWNVARTQAQIQTYMNSSLPNPTTTPGLLGYYTFDNLLNKQGNTAFNATLNGGASINATNPNCTFVADSCVVTPPPPACNSSFQLAKPSNSYVRILPAAPATYNQLYNSNGFSWETWFKLTGPITNLSTLISTEDAVLFHDIFLGFGWGSIPNALCFLVSDNGANNATVFAESAQSLTVGTWYHVAAVCDYSNAILRLYLNGNLIATKPIPIGILNDRLTTNVSTQLGNASSSLIYGINANIDETRFWNTVRTQAEIQANMNQCLSNPQPGLVAYFKADESAGTTAASTVNNNFSGALSNTIWGTQTPSVNCGCVTSASGIINDYTPVLGLNPCTNTLTVENATAYNVGDTVLLIQMKGAVIDSTNTATFGTITDYKNAGNYEFNYVKSKAGNVIELLNTLTRQYDIPVGKVQLVRVPYYNSVNVTGTLTCLPWDGNKGGVLVVNVRDTLELNADINTTGRGFLKGTMRNSNVNTFVCGVTDYYYADNTIHAAGKGEGISFLSTNRNSGKGAAANGGGGGMNTNSGGGGGSNGNIGGRGGYEWNGGCPNYLTSLNWGLPGKNLAYNNASNKIFMGGGGGAGHCNNQFDDPAFNADYNGGNGGGLVIINTNYLKNNSKKIISKGDSAYQPVFSPTYVTHDGMGAGGAGGTVLLNSNNYINNLVVDVSGGKGANMVSTTPPGFIGPGGGGGGGVVWLKQNSLPAAVAVTNAGGANGVITQAGNNPYGAAPGLAGINVFSLAVPFDVVPFIKNIDSVRIKDSLMSCNDFDFKGMAYVNTNPIVNWQWYFGDGGQANTQNTSHAYGAAGLYIVKLIVTDINGCIDSIMKDVNALPAVIADAGPDVSVCSNTTVSVTLNGNAVGGPYLWSPAAFLNNPTIQNPVATISSTTTFYLNVTGSATCTAIDSVTITINPVPLVNTRTDTTICRLSPLVLSTSSNATNFQWSPAASVSNPNIASPDFVGNTSGWVYVTGSYASGCAATDSLYVTVDPVPVVDARTDTAICFSAPLVLNTISDATTFQWSPAAYVSNATIASPNYIHNASGWIYVTGYFASGCSARDSLYVTVNPVPLVDTRTDTTICRLSPLVLTTNSNATTYAWSPAGDVSNPAIAGPNYIGNASGWVYVTGSFATGCSAIDSLYVTVNPVPFVDTRVDTAICLASPLVLNTNSDATTFQWNPAANVSNPIIANPNFTGTTSGWVYVTGYFASGCAATDSLYVTVTPVPFVDTRVDTAICLSSPLVLNTNSNATIFQWSPAGSVSNPAIANPDYTGNASGWVYVTGSTAAGCFAKDSLYVTVNPLPIVQTIADTVLCQNVNITLTTTGALTYSWSPGIGLSDPNIASPVFTGNSGQTYTVAGTDVNGCRNTDMVIVDVILPTLFKEPPAFTICQKQTQQLDGNNGNQVSYLWSPATYLSNATVRDPIANPPQTTLYTLLVTENRCGYDSTFTTLLTVVPAPVINARKSNDIDCSLRSATLFASGGNQYLWSPPTGLNNPNIANPVAITPITQTYTVLVTDATGCTNTDSVTVFNKTSASLARYMPNAFTPNNDGLNDCYGLKNWIYIKNLQFYIFNRFGEQVFATANPNTCWDGTYKGKPALAGTYVYVIKAQTDCGIEEQKGNFILIR